MSTKLSNVVGGIASAFARKTFSVTLLSASHTSATVQSQHAKTMRTYRVNSIVWAAERDANTHHLLKLK